MRVRALRWATFAVAFAVVAGHPQIHAEAGDLAGSSATASEVVSAGNTLSAEAADASDALARRLARIETFDATFTQTVFGSRGEILQNAKGRLLIARPHRFRWEVESPYPQTIVTVEDRIYLHDPDLDQVTIRGLDESLDGTPALILAGDPELITDAFTIEHTSALGDRFVLVPKDEESLYGELRLLFVGDELERIEILDSFGQVTEVSFFNVLLNKPADPTRFAFEIPVGAEVIDDVGDTAPQ